MGTTFGGGFLREDIHGVPKNDSGQNPDEFRRIYEEGGRGKEEIFKDKVDFLLVMYERERQGCAKDNADELDQTYKSFVAFQSFNNRWNGISKWILIAIRALILKQCHSREKEVNFLYWGFVF